MIPGSKGLNPHELAQMWVNVLETRQNMSLKVGRKHHDMRIFCRIVTATNVLFYRVSEADVRAC